MYDVIGGGRQEAKIHHAMRQPDTLHGSLIGVEGREGAMGSIVRVKAGARDTTVSCLLNGGRGAEQMMQRAEACELVSYLVVYWKARKRAAARREKSCRLSAARKKKRSGTNSIDGADNSNRAESTGRMNSSVNANSREIKPRQETSKRKSPKVGTSNGGEDEKSCGKTYNKREQLRECKQEVREGAKVGERGEYRG